MIPLIVLTGFLLVVSGGVKLVRAAKARLLGLAIVSLGELVVGTAVAAVAFGSPLTPEAGLRLIGGAVGLMLVSSVWYGFRLSALRKQREASEGSRLVTYVRYLSGGGSP